MNLSQFNSRKDSFRVLDLTARFSFKTESSISFSLERHSKGLLPTRQIGWIDLHYPCDGHIKVQVRISLPSEYHADDKFRAIVTAIFAAVSVPVDETWDAVLFETRGVMETGQPVNRDGLTDRLSAQQGASGNSRPLGS